MIKKARLTVLAIVLSAGWLTATVQAAETWIVKDGKANAEIVVRENPPRLLKLATEELQAYLRKISGAELPIAHKRGKDYPVAIYVGKSEGTDVLGINDTGLLEKDAYRMVSGPDYLVLLGHDSDYEISEARLREISKSKSKKRGFREGKNRASGIRPQGDKGGSLQAVYGFLRDLGVRWYMPGELGEVVPEHDSVALPDVNKTVVPDLRYRSLRLGNDSNYPWDQLVWHFRLGLNDNDLAGSHGMRKILYETKQHKEHPEYFSLYRNKRCNNPKMTEAHACYSHPGLKEVVVNYARKRFDTFDEKAISIMPEDGFKKCQCELCKGKTPSELVWSFVDSVARELYKTHPDRLVFCGSYTPYNNPPKNIIKFSPNVLVRISWMRPGLDDDTRWAEYWNMVQAWSSRLAPKRLMRNANIQWTAQKGFPIIHPRSIAREYNAMHGICLGEASSVPRRRLQKWRKPGLSHLNIYVLSSFMRNNKQDLKKLLDEYYTLFYGPASDEMRAAFEFAEEIYPRQGRPTPSRISYTDRLRFVELLYEAKAKAGDTIYGKRVQLIIDELQPLQELRQRSAMEEARGEVIEFPFMHPMERKQKAAKTFKLDGRLDELFWTDYYHGRGLKDNLTGKKRKKDKTRFYFKWYKNALYFGIRCVEPDMDKLKVTTAKNQDAAIHEGDCVILLLETQDMSYYEITFNPAGAVWDADRSEGGVGEKWSSQAEAAVFKGDGYWSLEARIPVTRQEDDPLHVVGGYKPTRGYPWYLNVIRKRPRKDGTEVTAWFPTKSEEIHNKFKFGKLYDKYSK